RWAGPGNPAQSPAVRASARASCSPVRGVSAAVNARSWVARCSLTVPAADSSARAAASSATVAARARSASAARAPASAAALRAASRSQPARSAACCAARSSPAPRLLRLPGPVQRRRGGRPRGLQRGRVLGRPLLGGGQLVAQPGGGGPVLVGFPPGLVPLPVGRRDVAGRLGPDGRDLPLHAGGA